MLRKLLGALIALPLVFGLTGPAGAKEDLAAGASGWGKQMQRAPHPAFAGPEFCKDKWRIILSQMSTYGQLKYDEAMNIAGFVQLAAPDCADDWLSKHVLFSGYGGVGFAVDEDGEYESGTAYSQQIYALLRDRLLLQVEGEFTRPFSSEYSTEFEGFDYLNLTYFLNNNVHASAGKLLSDFNFSNIRLHPGWINPYAELPWSTSFTPMSTLGGKLSFTKDVREGVNVHATVWGGVESSGRYFDAQQLAGVRLGASLPKHRLEVGTSFALVGDEADPVLGAYFIKKWTDFDFSGELAVDDNRLTYWAGSTFRPFDNGITFVARWQGISVDAPRGPVAQLHEEPGHEEPGHEEPTHEEPGHEEPGHEEPGHEEPLGPPHADVAGGHGGDGGHGAHGGAPEEDAGELYLGVNYDIPRFQLRGRSFDTRLKAGYAFGFEGDSGDRLLAGLTLHW